VDQEKWSSRAAPEIARYAKCEVATTDQVRQMERAGFVVDRVLRPDDELFYSFVLNSLFKGPPGALPWGRR